MSVANETMLDIIVTDATQQKVVNLTNLSGAGKIGELVSGLVKEMNLPNNDASGRQLTYHARLEREGRHMNAGEIIGEALRTNDRIMLAPNVDAGF